MRFVLDEKDTEIVDDTLTCLRRIECDTDTERSLPDGFKDGVYDA